MSAYLQGETACPLCTGWVSSLPDKTLGSSDDEADSEDDKNDLSWLDEL